MICDSIVYSKKFKVVKIYPQKYIFPGHRALCIPRVMLTLRRPGAGQARGRGHPGPGAITVTSGPVARGHRPLSLPRRVTRVARYRAACHTLFV